jgi:alcohol dehydrogenase, propanol-preferring
MRSSAVRAVLDRPGTQLMMRECPLPSPGPGEILIEIEACGVCRTDLHVVDGELPDPKRQRNPGVALLHIRLGPGFRIRG